MSNSFYYYLDNNVFSGLQYSELYYNSFFEDLSTLEKDLNLNIENKKFISTPFSIIEYLGIDKKLRLKPNQDVVRTFIKNHEPEKAFLEFVEYGLKFYDTEIEDYYTFLLEKDREKTKYLKPHIKTFWADLITNELCKEDFKAKLTESLRWDYITDWLNEMPNNGYRIDIPAKTSELLNYGINNVHTDSINLLRLVKIFTLQVDFEKFKCQYEELSEQIIQIEKRRDSMLKKDGLKIAGQDLVDTDITQLSVTGYKSNDQNIIPVISFTTDATDKIKDRVYSLKQIIGIYYNETIKSSDKTLIENFKEGAIVRLSRFTNQTPFDFEEIIYSEEIYERWLNNKSNEKND